MGLLFAKRHGRGASMIQKPAGKAKGPLVNVRYPYAPGHLEGGQRHNEQGREVSNCGPIRSPTKLIYFSRGGRSPCGLHAVFFLKTCDVSGALQVNISAHHGCGPRPHIDHYSPGRGPPMADRIFQMRTIGGSKIDVNL